jgi:hypothetical protein
VSTGRNLNLLVRLELKADGEGNIHILEISGLMQDERISADLHGNLMCMCKTFTKYDNSRNI